MTQTPLDRAHASMMADEADDTARLRFYERMADIEVFLLLEQEPDARFPGRGYSLAPGSRPLRAADAPRTRRSRA